VFNAFTGTALRGTKRRPAELMLILRGFAQGVPTAQLARELGCDRKELLTLRHRPQHVAWRFRAQWRLDDPVVETDEGSFPLLLGLVGHRAGTLLRPDLGVRASPLLAAGLDPRDRFAIRIEVSAILLRPGAHPWYGRWPSERSSRPSSSSWS
jgi:hypothetical protein